MLSTAKHLLFLIEKKRSRSFAPLRMTWLEVFFSSLASLVGEHKRS